MPLDSNVSNDTITECMREWSRQKRRCAEEQGVLRNIAKRAKAAGINIRAMTEAEKASKLEPEDVVRDLSDQIRYMALRKIEITADALYGSWDTEVTQKTSTEDQTWEAEDAGYAAGRHGVPYDDCPYPPGTELDVRWRDHWHKGQAAIARELGSDAKPASVSRKRPSVSDEAAHARPAKRTAPARKAKGTGRSGRRSTAGAEPDSVTV